MRAVELAGRALELAGRPGANRGPGGGAEERQITERRSWYVVIRLLVIGPFSFFSHFPLIQIARSIYKITSSFDRSQIHCQDRKFNSKI